MGAGCRCDPQHAAGAVFGEPAESRALASSPMSAVSTHLSRTESANSSRCSVTEETAIAQSGRFCLGISRFLFVGGIACLENLCKPSKASNLALLSPTTSCFTALPSAKFPNWFRHLSNFKRFHLEATANPDLKSEQAPEVLRTLHGRRTGP